MSVQRCSRWRCFGLATDYTKTLFLTWVPDLGRVGHLLCLPAVASLRCCPRVLCQLPAVCGVIAPGCVFWGVVATNSFVTMGVQQEGS